MEEWVIRIINDQESADFVYLLFAKAFDSVILRFLLMKCHAYGVHGESVSWIAAFFRYHIVACLRQSKSLRSYSCGDWNPSRFSPRTTPFPALRQRSSYWQSSPLCAMWYLLDNYVLNRAKASTKSILFNTLLKKGIYYKAEQM